MKKVILLLLVAVVCVSAFATYPLYLVPSFGLSATVSFDEGFGFEGVGAFGKLVIGGTQHNHSINGARCEVKSEFKYSFAKDAKVTGLYVDVLGGYFYDGATFQGGFGSDFHMIDGKLVANVGALAGVTFCVDDTTNNYQFAVTAVTARYNFINKSGASAFTMNYSAGFSFDPSKGN